MLSRQKPSALPTLSWGLGTQTLKGSFVEARAQVKLHNSPQPQTGMARTASGPGTAAPPSARRGVKRTWQSLQGAVVAPTLSTPRPVFSNLALGSVTYRSQMTSGARRRLTKAVRRDCGSKALRHSAVADSTLRLYTAAVQRFVDWASDHRRSLHLRSLGQAMEDFFWEHAQLGMSPALGRHVLYGWLHLRAPVPSLPACKLENAHRALTGWRKIWGDAARDGFPEEFVFAIGAKLLDRKFFLAAAAVAVQFGLYLRIGELLNLHSQDLVLPQRGAGPRYKSVAAQICPRDRVEVTKAGATDDTVVVDAKSPAFLRATLLELGRITPTGHRIFSRWTINRLEQVFKEAAAAAGLGCFAMCPHVVRHSAACNDFYHGRRSLPEIMKRGRWAATKSVARYEKSGRMLAMWAKVPLCTRDSVHTASSRFQKSLVPCLKSLPRWKIPTASSL